MVAQLTASAVAEMESELALLRTDNQKLQTMLALAETERDAKKIEVTLITQKWQEEMIRATQMETIMSQVSMGLVSGLHKMQEQKARARQARQASQENDLQVGQHDHSPVYAPSRSFASGGFVEPDHTESVRGIDFQQVSRARRPAVDERQPIERLGGERVGPPRPRSDGLVMRANDPRTNIIDERLPKVDLRTDQDDIRDLANQIAPEQRS